jgi:hypothetical protein
MNDQKEIKIYIFGPDYGFFEDMLTIIRKMSKQKKKNMEK